MSRARLQYSHLRDKRTHCAARGCALRRYKKNDPARLTDGFCMEHACQTPKCNKQRLPSSNMCEEHALPRKERSDRGKLIKTGTYHKMMPVWAGYVEDKATPSKWILYYGWDGRALFYANRAEDGGVIEPGVPSGFEYGTKKLTFKPTKKA